MKSKTSCFNKTIFLKNITRFWPIWLGYILIFLFGVAGRLYQNFQYSVKVSGYTKDEAEALKEYSLALVTDNASDPIIIFGIALLAAAAVFSYLYSTRSANMMHALPVTRKELYFTNYVSGLTMLLIPELLAFLVSVLVCTMSQVTSLEYVLLWFLYVAGMSVFFFSFIVFVGMLTGNLIAMPILTVIINFLFIAVKMLFGELVSNLSYGVSNTMADSVADMLSPLYYLKNHVGATFDYTGNIAVCTGFFGGKEIGIYTIASIAFAVFSYFIYKKRHLEKTGDLLSVDLLKPVFRWGAAWCAAFTGASFFGEIISINGSVQVSIVWLVIGMVLCGGIAFFAAQMLLDKNFRVFQKKRIIEWCIMGVLIIGVAAAVEGDILGIEKQIPKTEDIQAISYNLSYIASAEDVDTIEAVKTIHQQIIDSKEEFEAYKKKHKAEDSGYFWITYFLKDGRKFDRAYLIPNSKEYIDNPDSVYAKIMDLSSREETYFKSMIGMNYKDAVLQGGSLELYEENNAYHSVQIDTEDIHNIFEAFRMDLKEGNLKKLYDLTGEEYKKNTFYNSLTLNFNVEGGLVDVYQYYNALRGDRNIYDIGYNSTVDFTFSKDCTNVIQALIDAGVIQGESELLTVEEKEEIDAAVNK